jgi:Fe-S-cluster-containing dehydrogenase component
MNKWALIIDVEKCENCNNCLMACKDEHCGNDWPGYSMPQPDHGHRWIRILQHERGQLPIIDVAYLPKACMHCDDPACLRAAENQAVTKRPDGIVLIDPQKARGQKQLVQACPFGAIWWNEEYQVPQKCTLCAHLLDSGWSKPRCVQACPTGALTVFHGTDAQLQARAASQNLEVLEGPHRSAGPRVYYKNQYRYTDAFIAGSVATVWNDQSECVAGARVELHRDGSLIRHTESDLFGDFKFDRLPVDSGAYDLSIQWGGRTKQLSVPLGDSQTVGTIWI